MRVSYQHANSHHGNESFLLRFHRGDQTNCVLVDAGDGVTLLHPLWGIELQHGREVELTIDAEHDTHADD